MICGCCGRLAKDMGTIDIKHNPMFICDPCPCGKYHFLTKSNQPPPMQVEKPVPIPAPKRQRLNKYK